MRYTPVAIPETARDPNSGRSPSSQARYADALSEEMVMKTNGKNSLDGFSECGM